MVLHCAIGCGFGSHIEEIPAHRGNDIASGNNIVMIRIKIKKRTPLKLRKRLRNKARLRKKVFGTVDRPRLVVFRSQKHIYAQLVDDSAGKVLGSTHTLKMNGESGNCQGANKAGQQIAKLALEKDIKKVVFDRNGFIYHGRVKALAESARKAGLIF